MQRQSPTKTTGYYFDQEDFTKNNILGDLLIFAKVQRIPSRPFIFFSKNPALIGNLTLKENYLLDAFPFQIGQDKEKTFTNFCEQQEDKDFVSLLENFSAWDKLPRAATLEEKRFVGLCKILTKKSSLILLDFPEFSLNQDILFQFRKCLLRKCRQEKSRVFLRTEIFHFWRELVQTKVSKNKDQYSLQTLDHKVEPLLATQNESSGIIPFPSESDKKKSA